MVGVDIGGTKTALLAWDLTTSAVLAQNVFPTPTEIGPEAMVDRLVAAIDALISQCGRERANLRGLGVAVPGLVDAGAGIVLTAGNLNGWSRVPLRDLLAVRLHIPVAIEHDANAAASANAGAARRESLRALPSSPSAPASGWASSSMGSSIAARTTPRASSVIWLWGGIFSGRSAAARGTWRS